MATLHYDGQRFVLDNEAAGQFQFLIKVLLDSGNIEWLPLSGIADGEEITTNILIAPGIPIRVETDGMDDNAFKALVTKYLAPSSDTESN